MEQKPKTWKKSGRTPARRNVIAHDLVTNSLYKQKVVADPTRYTRKDKHKKREPRMENTLDEDYVDYTSPNKPKYTLTTSSDDGETSSTSTVTTSEPDALIQILKSAGVTDVRPEIDLDHHDDLEMDNDIDFEVGDCDDMNYDDEEPLEDDIEVGMMPQTPGSRANSTDDMKFLLNLVSDNVLDEEVEDDDWDNSPDEFDLPWDAGSAPRNTTNLKHDVAGVGDNKLAYTEEEKLSNRLMSEWKTALS